jgi:hypothetical protein
LHIWFRTNFKKFTSFLNAFSDGKFFGCFFTRYETLYSIISSLTIVWLFGISPVEGCVWSVIELYDADRLILSLVWHLFKSFYTIVLNILKLYFPNERLELALMSNTFSNSFILSISNWYAIFYFLAANYEFMLYWYFSNIFSGLYSDKAYLALLKIVS